MIPVAVPLDRAMNEDEQVVQRFLSQKNAFSVSALWSTVASRIGNCWVALRAQKEQMQMNEAKENAKSQSRLERHLKLLENAQSMLQKDDTAGTRRDDALNEKDWGAVERWVLRQANVVGRMSDLKEKANIIAKLAALDRHWTSFIPLPTPE